MHYKVIPSQEPLYRGSTEILSQADTQRKLLVISPAAKGRHRMVAIADAYLAAYSHETGGQEITVDDRARIATLFEHMSANRLREETARDTLPGPAPRKGLRPRVYFGLGAAAALVIASVVVNFSWSRPAPAPQAQSTTPANSGYDLTYGMQEHPVAFNPPALALAIHPTLPAFVVADDECQVYLTNWPFGHSTLAKTDAPAYWIHVSADGLEAVILDWSGALTVVDLDLDRLLDLDQEPTQYRPAIRPTRAYALGGGQVLCVDGLQSTAWYLGESGQLPSNTNTAMPATSDSRLVAIEQTGPAGDSLSIVDRGSPSDPLLTRRMFPPQTLKSFDLSEDRSTALLYLSDGTLSLYKNHGYGLKLESEIGMGDDDNIKFIQVSPSGDLAWVGGGRLVQWNLQTFVPTSSAGIDSIHSVTPVAHRVQTGSNRIIIASKELGLIWE